MHMGIGSSLKFGIGLRGSAMIVGRSRALRLPATPCYQVPTAGAVLASSWIQTRLGTDSIGATGSARWFGMRAAN